MKEILLIFKKELKDIFRDKKTFVVSIVIPLLLFPVLFGVIGKSASSMTKEVENNLKIAVKDEGNSSLGKFIKEQKNLVVTNVKDEEEAVKKGDVFIAVIIDKNFDANLEKESENNLKVVYDNSSQKSQMAMSVLKNVIDGYSKVVVSERLSKKGISTQILTPVNVKSETIEKKEEGSSKMILSLLLPMFILIYSVTGPMASAVDLAAGEKERCTLESLLTTPVNRMSLLWGKLFAITVMGFLTSLSSIAGVIISMKTSPDVFGNAGSGSLTLEPLTLFYIGMIALLTTMVFGALEFAISIYARSFKEAQTYLAPLNIVAIIPVYATYIMDAKNISSVYFHIPVANISCLMKELISGIYNFSHITIVFGWIVFYIVVSMLFARYMFSKEQVIFRT